MPLLPPHLKHSLLVIGCLLPALAHAQYPSETQGENRRGRARAHQSIQLRPQRRAAAARPFQSQPGPRGPVAALAAR
ncbi:MAG: hypothetical protein WKG07_18975 [Hymenobacter sp.]